MIKEEIKDLTAWLTVNKSRVLSQINSGLVVDEQKVIASNLAANNRLDELNKELQEIESKPDKKIAASDVIEMFKFLKEKVTRKEVEEMTNDDLDGIIIGYSELVFARMTPEQKLLVVESCQRIGAIVAVTGDGVGATEASRRIASRDSSSSRGFNATTCSSLIKTSLSRVIINCAASRRLSVRSRTTSKNSQLALPKVSAPTCACPKLRLTAASEVCRFALASVVTTSPSAACAKEARSA